MRWPHNSLTDNEEIITSFRPHWKLLVFPIGIGVLILAAGIALEVFIDAVTWVRWLAVVALILFFVVRPLVDWWYTRYVLTTERLITRKGLIAQSGIEIPLERITNVNFSQNVIERLLGAGDLLVESAGETGQSQFADIPHPDRFQAVLYKAREARTVALGGGSERGNRPSGAEAIRELAQLRDEGHITEEEYERKRAEILRDM